MIVQRSPIAVCSSPLPNAPWAFGLAHTPWPSLYRLANTVLASGWVIQTSPIQNGNNYQADVLEVKTGNRLMLQLNWTIGASPQLLVLGYGAEGAYVNLSPSQCLSMLTLVQAWVAAINLDF